MRASIAAGSRRARAQVMPGGGDQHQLVDAVRLGDRHLGGDEAAHRVADDRGVVDPELLAEVAQEGAVGLDRDVPRGHRAGAEAGQVERDHPVVAREDRDLLEPVLPRAREPVDEDDRRALAHLDVVDPRPDDVDLAAVRRPVDLEPLRGRARRTDRAHPAGSGRGGPPSPVARSIAWRVSEAIRRSSSRPVRGPVVVVGIAAMLARRE